MGLFLKENLFGPILLLFSKEIYSKAANLSAVNVSYKKESRDRLRQGNKQGSEGGEENSGSWNRKLKVKIMFKLE